MRIYSRFSATVLLASFMVLSGCNSKSGSMSTKSKYSAPTSQAKPMLYSTSGNFFSETGGITIVPGLEYRPMKVKHFQIVKLTVRDATGKEFPYSIVRHPDGKMGPMASIEVPLTKANSEVSVNGIVKYLSHTYKLHAIFKYNEKGICPWELVKNDIH